MRKIILDRDQKEKIITLFKNGTNITLIQKICNLRRRTIENTIQENGLVLKTKSQLIVEAIPQLNDKTYLESLYFDKKLCLTEISTILKTNDQVIKTSFKRLGIKPRSTKDAKITSVVKHCPLLCDKDFLIKEYIDNKKSPKQIAKIIGCSSKAVVTALKENKINKRTHSESAKLQRSTPRQKVNAKIAANLRTRFWIALSGKSKMVSAVRDLGCSVEEFKSKVTSQFYPDPETKETMSWDNYGKWEIDHIEPLSSMDLSIKDNQSKACHYSNLQPLWIKHNRAKSDTILGPKPMRVPLYLVVGPAGCGKSWVCDQLEDVNYIPSDSVPKEQHYHYMIEMSKNGRPIIFDPFRKFKTLYNRYASLFDIKLIVINESSDIVESRLRSRGSVISKEKISKYVDKFNKITYADFKGTSIEVLEFLKKDLNNSKKPITPPKINHFTGVHNPLLPTVYLLVGAPASGKSWVASQLADKFEYISYDSNRKKTHLDLLKIPSIKPKLYDPTFKISTIIRRHSNEFNFILVGIYEKEQILRGRMNLRGGVWTDTVMKRNEVAKKRYEKYGTNGFLGTSQEVLEFLKKQ